MRRTHRAHTRAVVLATATAMAGLKAQVPTLVRPGSALVDGRKIPLGEHEMRGMRHDAAGDVETGQSRDIIREATANGQPALLRVLTVTHGDVTTTDSILMIRKTLAPVWKHSYSPSRVLILNFDGQRVTGENRHDGQVDTIRVDAPEPVFEAFSADLPLAALELREGMQVRLPVYHPTNGFVWLVATAGTPQSVPTSTHALPLDITEGSVKMIWYVDTQTHEQLGAVNRLPNGSEVRIFRRP
jgi:hypothetical protein